MGTVFFDIECITDPKAGISTLGGFVSPPHAACEIVAVAYLVSADNYSPTFVRSGVVSGDSERQVIHDFYDLTKRDDTFVAWGLTEGQEPIVKVRERLHNRYRNFTIGWDPSTEYGSPNHPGDLDICSNVYGLPIVHPTISKAEVQEPDIARLNIVERVAALCLRAKGRKDVWDDWRAAKIFKTMELPEWA